MSIIHQQKKDGVPPTLILWWAVSSMQVRMALAVREADRRGGGLRNPSFRILQQIK
jgi:hypothetical protein